jgi:hypothetical protein
MVDSLRCVACSSGRQWTTVQWRKQIRKHPFRIATFFLSIVMLAFAPGAWAQEQTNPGPQAGAKPAKEQLNQRNLKPIPAPVRKLCRKQHRTPSPASSACRFKTTTTLV